MKPTLLHLAFAAALALPGLTACHKTEGTPSAQSGDELKPGKKHGVKKDGSKKDKKKDKKTKDAAAPANPAPVVP